MKVLLSAYNPLIQSPQSIPSGLEELSLTGCGLTEIPKGNFPEMKFLHLAGNKITAVARNLASCDKIDSIDLSHNSIIHVPSFLMEKLESDLCDLHLERNKLSIPSMHSPSAFQPDTCEHVTIGKSDMRGKRDAMEDSVCAVGQLCGHDLLCIFDGHGGHELASLASGFAQEQIMEALEAFPNDVRNALITGIKGINKACREALGAHPQQVKVGTTALVALIDDSSYIMGNLGDTRAVLFQSATQPNALRLTVDHRPLDEEEEYRRVISLGGYVSETGRVNGMLAVSKALGDFFLTPYVSDDPFIAQGVLKDDDEFIIMACDGVWDVVTDEVACRLVAQSLFQFLETPDEAALRLRTWAYIQGSTDNITVMIVLLPIGAEHRRMLSAARQQNGEPLPMSTASSGLQAVRFVRGHNHSVSCNPGRPRVSPARPAPSITPDNLSTQQLVTPPSASMISDDILAQALEGIAATNINALSPGSSSSAESATSSIVTSATSATSAASAASATSSTTTTSTAAPTLNTGNGNGANIPFALPSSTSSSSFFMPPSSLSASAPYMASPFSSNPFANNSNFNTTNNANTSNDITMQTPTTPTNAMHAPSLPTVPMSSNPFAPHGNFGTSSALSDANSLTQSAGPALQGFRSIPFSF